VAFSGSAADAIHWPSILKMSKCSSCRSEDLFKNIYYFKEKAASNLEIWKLTL